MHRIPRLLLSLALLTMALLPAAPTVGAQAAEDPRYFEATGYRVDNDRFWNFFERRGGLRTFGYPVSREFRLLGLPVQVFQRIVMQQRPDGSVATLNLLDEGLRP